MNGAPVENFPGDYGCFCLVRLYFSAVVSSNPTNLLRLIFRAMFIYIFSTVVCMVGVCLWCVSLRFVAGLFFLSFLFLNKSILYFSIRANKY